MADPDEMMKRMKDEARAEDEAARKEEDYELRVDAARRKLRKKMPVLFRPIGEGVLPSEDSYMRGHSFVDPRVDRDRAVLQASGVETSPEGSQYEGVRVYDDNQAFRPTRVGDTSRRYMFKQRGVMPAAVITTPNLGKIKTEVMTEEGRPVAALDRMVALAEFNKRIENAKTKLSGDNDLTPEMEEALFQVMAVEARRLNLADAELARNLKELEVMAEAEAVGIEGAGGVLPVSRLKGTAGDYRARSRREN